MYSGSRVLKDGKPNSSEVTTGTKHADPKLHRMTETFAGCKDCSILHVIYTILYILKSTSVVLDQCFGHLQFLRPLLGAPSSVLRPLRSAVPGEWGPGRDWPSKLAGCAAGQVVSKRGWPTSG